MNIAPFVSAASAPIELLSVDRFWVSKKTRPTQFATNKNRPGKDYAKEKENNDGVPEATTGGIQNPLPTDSGS